MERSNLIILLALVIQTTCANSVSVDSKAAIKILEHIHGGPFSNTDTTLDEGHSTPKKKQSMARQNLDFDKNWSVY
jgi:hypothetical protein